MMKPLNRVERNNAFLGFVVLFSITIGIVILVAFFSIEVLSRENQQMRKRLVILEYEKKLTDSFRVAMDVTLNELVTFDAKTKPAIITKTSVQKKIEKMGMIIKKLPEEMSPEGKSIYELVIQNLADLNDAKTKIRNLEDQIK